MSLPVLCTAPTPVNKRAVRILLECFLVSNNLCILKLEIIKYLL